MEPARRDRAHCSSISILRRHLDGQHRPRTHPPPRRLAGSTLRDAVMPTTVPRLDRTSTLDLRPNADQAGRIARSTRRAGG
jgi:hypothetical protein